MLLSCALVLCLGGCAAGVDDFRANSALTEQGYYLVEGGELTVSLGEADEPFYVENGYEPTGFAVDLLKMLAQELGLKCSFAVNDNADEALTAVVGKSGDDAAPVTLISKSADSAFGPRADVGLESYADDVSSFDARSTDPYAEVGLAICVRGTKASTSLDDLDKGDIGVVEGSYAQQWMKDNHPKATLKAMKNAAELFASLQKKRIRAALCDQQIAERAIRTTYQDLVVIESVQTDRVARFYVSGDNAALEEALNEALAKVKEDGRYDELYDSWFGRPEKSKAKARPIDPSFAAETYNKAAG